MKSFSNFFVCSCSETKESPKGLQKTAKVTPVMNQLAQVPAVYPPFIDPYASPVSPRSVSTSENWANEEIHEKRYFLFPSANLCGRDLDVKAIAEVLNRAFNGQTVGNKFIGGYSIRGIKKSDLYHTLAEVKMQESNDTDLAYLEFNLPQHLLQNDIVHVEIDHVARVLTQAGRELLTGEYIKQNIFSQSPVAVYSPRGLNNN